MSKTDLCPPQQNESAGSSSCSTPQIEIMEELNKHFSERIQTIEEAGYTELLVCNLKKWIEALVDNDKSLVATIDSLEREVMQKSDKISLICKERLEMDDICDKFKMDMCEKSELLNELNCKLKEQTETLSHKECIIKRLTQEVDQLKSYLNKLRSEKGDSNKESDSRISDMKCELNNLREEVQRKECCIKKLEEDLCICKKKIEEINDDNQEKWADEKLESLQVKDLLNKLTSIKARITIKDENIENQFEMIQDLLEQKNKKLADFKLNLIPYIEEEEKQQDCVKDTNIKLEESRTEIERLNKVLVTKQSTGESEQLELLRKNLDNMKRENRDMKEALTAEVCEKHDMITSLRRDTAQLEEKARQADMQAIFKDDIIKELRKEVKIARAKHQSESDQDIKIQVMETGDSTKILYSEDSLQVRIIADTVVVPSTDKTVQTITKIK